ncbi:T5orf172 domain-containing protein [Luteibacter sp. OK325]|uniref:GIY-YIG nuclease family protein n=1 Tax=Luteibacter sp. OK325 TaxID=2135670 RepID=UPI000D365903|nr:GIY-YIG nuclease family protein [Luteibacter sp. OK325]PTR28491.1 T5orf172 domain-containing protein [Luteibacter sp. OK325]
MKRVRKTLDELFLEDDPFGLLDVKPVRAAAGDDKSRLFEAFEEICQFIDAHGHVPGEGAASGRISLSERRLKERLRVYRADQAMFERLSAVDRHGLLEGIRAQTVPQSLDDLLDEPLLDSPEPDIFVRRHAVLRGAQPDRISARIPCSEFEKFAPLFKQCTADLISGVRQSKRFANEQEIDVGQFFILRGVMVYVAEVNEPHVRNGKRNARLRLIFDNGTEGQNLLRSLATELYKDPSGRRISSASIGPLFEAAASGAMAPDSLGVGRVYVARSMSPDPKIASLDGRLYKIGVTTGSVADRVRGAASDPTFLFAPVRVIREFEVLNFDPIRLEAILHRFFSSARLAIDIPGHFGKPFHPKEWFLIDLAVIDQVIPLIVKGELSGSYYDPDTETIVSALDAGE